MTVQKKILDLTGSQYLVQKVKSAINDVDSSLSTHIADTDIHVTTADKNRWNNNTYVFRYSSTALVASSTNSNTLLDNTDNLKVGDKVIDSDGVLFSITAIDTANSTFTIGTALIDLAQDSDIVHTSGNETVAGVKTFTDFMRLKSNVAEYGVTGGNSQFYLIDKNNVSLSKITQGAFDNGVSYITLQLYGKDSNNQTVTNTIRYQYSSDFGYSYLLPTDNSVQLGSTGNRWKSVYATNYYYGANNVEFSTKFVTTDTNQTIAGKKIFSDDLTIYNYDSSQSTKNLNIGSSKIQVGDTSNSDAFGIRLNAGASYVAQILAVNDATGTQNLQLSVRTKDGSDNYITSMVRSRVSTNGNSSFESGANNSTSLGSSNYKWKDVQTYQINGLEPSSLSLPSDRSARIDISGYFTNTGTGNTNDYSVPANGFIFLNLLNTFAVLCYSIDGTNNTNYAQSFFRQVDGQIYILFPVRKNDVFRTLWTSNGGTITVTGAYFIPCQGNV